LGREIVRLCRLRGVECVTLGAVSSLDVLASGRRLEAAGGEGLQVYTHAALQGACVDPSRPLLLIDTLELDRRAVTRTERVLRRLYPSSQRGWMFGPIYDAGPVAVELWRLSAEFPGMASSLMLLIPPSDQARASPRGVR
jgi:hypothetical protein